MLTHDAGLSFFWFFENATENPATGACIVGRAASKAANQKLI
jgi:hypothetical protein